jgi:Domain of unknown function (DUF1963)
MQLAQREMEKDGQTWVAGLSVGPVSIDCYTTSAPNRGYTPFEASRLKQGVAPTTTEAACDLFAEMTQRRGADGWVETERSRSRRCFHHPGDPEVPYWMIHLNHLFGRSVNIEFGRPGEIGPSGYPEDRLRRQVREFEDVEALRRWYASEVAKRLYEGYVELISHPTEFSDLGSDPSILAEDVDPGELTEDNVADLGSPTAIWMEKMRRPSWKPVTTEGDGPETSSKFSGLPWLARPEDWPECPSCKVPMQLLLQLNLGELPEEIGLTIGTGLFQFFACLRDECSEEAGNFLQPYPKNQVRRIIEPSGTSRAVIPEGVEPFPPKLITGWTVQDDYPSGEERGSMDEDEDGVGVVSSEGLDQQYPTIAGDKLGGWPYWIQGVEYPMCERCGSQMRLLFQIDSVDNLPHRWGDNGSAHLTQCETHKEVIAFDWACG